ncbi:MAG: hypothetical protein ACYTBJ_07965 [Planctomycetota bacterium]
MKVKCSMLICIVMCVCLFGAGDCFAEAAGELILKVDFGCPSNLLTFKQGWTPWAIPNGCDGRPQQGVWLNDIGGSGINAYLSSYDDLSMGNLRIGYGDAICNTNYQWHHPGNRQGSSRTFRTPGAPDSNLELTFIGPGFIAGEYELRTYHTYPVKSVNMASIKVTGYGVTQLNELKNIPIQQVKKDKDLVPSVLRFYVTGQGPAKITYESGQGHDSNAIINAFELVRVKPSLRPTKPFPADKAKFVSTDTKLSWQPGPKGVTYNVIFAQSAGDINPKTEPTKAGLTEPVLDIRRLHPKGLRADTEYFWRADYVFGDGRIARSDKWSFRTNGPNAKPEETHVATESRLMFKVDLALPLADGVPYPGTAKEGWTIWASPTWWDMYAHDGQWLRNIDGSGVNAFITLGNNGMGSLKVKGMRMDSKAGDGPPMGMPSADPICNTWYYSADWASHKSVWGNIVLYFENLPAGTYTLYSYHNFWYYCDRYECDCGPGFVEYRGEYRANKPAQGPMPSIKAMSLPEKPPATWLATKDAGWVLPKGTGKGVTAIQNAYHVEAQHVEHDEELIPSIVKFRTDGSPVVIIYEAPQDYWDYRDYPGGRAILNAFRLESVTQQ